METIEDLTAFLTETTTDTYRGRLQARGQARALMRHDGVLPSDAPVFAVGIDQDLADYGFSMLRAAMALREQNGDATVWQRGFVRAGNAFESLVQNGNAEDVTRGFFRIIGAAAYHLASYSALAFSLISQAVGAQNRAPIEEALALLIIRDLETLRRRAKAWLQDAAHNDAAIAQAAADGTIDSDDVVVVVATSTMFRALAFYEFALQTGAESLMAEARRLLARGISLATYSNAVSIWWILRLTANLIDGLWESSLHRVLPTAGPPGPGNYPALKRNFVSALFARRTAEVELWPSQRLAAQRAVDITDDLVVALPTSAGKTRIAEMAALMALASGRRVLIVTPLRALSAQTERSFRKTFAPLGFSVSSLYGSSGLAGTDEDALRRQSIVIATPEKLDFALRNDTTIIDDVGLIVLDEGHMIGPSEREIRYESLVQRLLRRADHANRRIVCLSAILPDGEQIDDLTAWIRHDTPGDPIQSNWRPTRQRFGTLSWLGTSAQLSFDLEDDGPFIRHFVPEIPAIKPRKTSFPKNNKELTLAAAWKFAKQGKRTLIFCTQRDHVEGFAETALDVQHRGFLSSLLDDAHAVERGLAVGREWLGENHPAVRCLAIGVAVHHGRLPPPFLREVEMLLASGILRVAIASPTLAQGLNLNAAVLLVPNLYRAGKLIPGEEFANVAGRAGRAYVDLEGLVVHVMHDRLAWRRWQWRSIVESARARSLSSGIIDVIDQVMKRLAPTNVFSRSDAMAYLSNAQEAWFPPGSAASDGEDSMESLIERLDATVLSLIDALDADSADLPRLLDEALTGSLWARQIARQASERKPNQEWILLSRAQLIWNKTTGLQRRAQFAMGVGLESGLAISAMANELTQRLDDADFFAVLGDADSLAQALIQVAEHILCIRPFIPNDAIPPDWQHILNSWIRGDDVANIGLTNMRFVEDAFVYRLVWALEALRMNRRASGGEPAKLEGAAAACLETGLPSKDMAMLVRTGLPSRVAAKIVFDEFKPNFATRAQMNQWLRSPEVVALDSQVNWPTPDTHAIWLRFRAQSQEDVTEKWEIQEWTMSLTAGTPTLTNYPGRLEIDSQSGQVSVTTPGFRELFRIASRLEQHKPGLIHVEFSADGKQARIVRIGRGMAKWIEPT